MRRDRCSLFSVPSLLASSPVHTLYAHSLSFQPQDRLARGNSSQRPSATARAIDEEIEYGMGGRIRSPFDCHSNAQVLLATTREWQCSRVVPHWRQLQTRCRRAAHRPTRLTEVLFSSPKISIGDGIPLSYRANEHSYCEGHGTGLSNHSLEPA